MQESTTVDASDQLIGWLVRFLSFSDRRYRQGLSVLEPLFNLAACWEFWWESSVCEKEQIEICNESSRILGEDQKDFIENVLAWFTIKFGSEAAARCGLLQISTIPIFAQWRAFEDLRAQSSNRVNFPVVRHGSDGAVEGLCVFLRPRPDGEPYIKCSSSVLLGAADIVKARDAVLHFFEGPSVLRAIFVGSLAGWLSSRKLGRFLALAAWSAVLFGIGTLVAFGPRIEHVSVQYILSSILCLSILLAFYPLLRCLQEFRFSRQIRRILETHQVCILPGNLRNKAPVAAVGSSFTLALGIGILSSALDLAHPSRISWLWGWLGERLKCRLPNWAFTGVLFSDGTIGAVDGDHLPIKHEACRVRPEITVMVTPHQRLDRSSVTPKYDRLQDPRQILASMPIGSALKVCRSRTLFDVCLDIGGIRSRAGVFNAVLASFCGVCLLIAIPEMWRIYNPPPVPRPVLWKCEEANYSKASGRVFHFVVETKYPRAFVVRITSPKLMKKRLLLYPDNQAAGQAWTEIPMTDGNDNGQGNDWSVEIVLPNSFLGRPLKDTVVLEEGLEGLRLAAASELQTLFRTKEDQK